MSTNLLIIILFILAETQLLWYRYKPLYKILKKNKKDNVTKTLADKQKQDDIILERDKDLGAIDKYVEYIATVISRFNKSRNKIIAYRIRQELLIKTIHIIPIASKYITVKCYYNLEDKEWCKLTDKDLMLALESSYNAYTHENLQSLDDIFSIAIRLRDDRK